MKKIFYTVTSLLLSFGAIAQTLLVEEFNYGASTGDVTTLSGGQWTAHSGAANNPVPYATNSLTISGYGGTSAGGSVNVTQASGTREDINKAISSKVTSGTVYASVIANITSSGTTTGDYFFHLTDTFGVSTAFTAKSNNFKGRIFIRQGSAGATTFNVGLSKGSTSAAAISWSGDYTVGTTYAFVLRYTFIAGTLNDSVALYVFTGSVPASEPTSATLLATDNLTISDMTSMDAVCLRQGSLGTFVTNVDAIRVGMSWANAPLPVSWKSFAAAKTTDGNALRWSTASETNNSHFEVQRSLDGRNFEAIGRVKGAGNTTRVSSYTFTDADSRIISSRTVYYRLKQVDFDGKSSLSRMVSVVAEARTGLDASLPNPFNNALTVTVNAASASTATVTLMDMIGKVYFTSNETLVAGANKVNIETTDMPNGIYFVRVEANGETFTQKVIKK